MKLADDLSPRTWLVNDRGETVSLTPTEVKVLQSIGRGNNPPKVAIDLSVSPSTVHTHLTRIALKLGTRGFLQSYLCFQKSHPVQPPDGRSEPLIAKLDSAEALMREVMFVPIVTKFWPLAVPDLLEALKKLESARTLLRAPVKII